MKKIIGLIILVITLLSGCNIEDFKFLKSFNHSLCLNVSYAPTEQFCNDINMIFVEYGNLISNEWGCIDDKGEIHSYATANINDEWIIGDRSYDVEWVCK